MTEEVIHSIILIITIAVSFFLPKTNLINYDLQISAVLFIILFIGKKMGRYKSRLLESVVFTLVILITVNSTGGVQSPFFFLIYFLLFSISLLIEPIVSISATLTLVIFFLLMMPPNQEIRNFLPIFSLAFLTPFALFMGQEYLRNEKLKHQNSRLKKNTFFFLSLVIKNHLDNIQQAVENFNGDHQLEIIRRSAKAMKKLVNKFEAQLK